jgi:hypothetical protein
MPYGISANQSDCSNWAAVKIETDGSATTLECYTTKQDAIDRMVAQSLAEGLEPVGEVGNQRQLVEVESEDDTEEMLEGLSNMDEKGLNGRQFAMYEFYEEVVEQFGIFNQGDGANGAHYVAESPFKDSGLICGNCVFYEGGQVCEIVEGRIAPNGICKLWIINEELLGIKSEDSAPMIEPEEEYEESEFRAIDLSAPAFMRASAKRGLALHEQGLSGDGLVPQTVEDARKMASGEVTEAKWRKIGAWIARHINDLDAVQGDEITAGLVAMLLWGGGSSKASARRAQDYAYRIVERLDSERAAAPAKDQIFGSEKNPAGSAKDQGGGITLNESTETALQNKADEHNAKMKEDDKPDWTRVRVGALKSVYRRGAGAFSTSHRPNMTRGQWAMARVNAFLYLSANGKPENANYVQDNDLLNSGHPKYSEDNE